MKQITEKQAQDLACSKEHILKIEIEYCQADWIKENARRIADIELKRANKTYYGLWSKGWKAAMKQESVERAKSDLTKRFIRKECFQLDGVLWLGNMQIIDQMERPKAVQTA